MMLLLFSTLLAHDSTSCEQVRHARQLAVAADLDTGTLDTLEARMCSTAVPPVQPAHPRPHADGPLCHDLTVLSLMATIEPDDDIGQVHTSRTLYCASGGDSLRTWDSGLSAHAGGNWGWPNGLTAISNGRMQWPNGLTARTSNGAWSYPNGLTALSSRGTWASPDGISVGTEQDLLNWACNRDEAACLQTANRLAHIEHADIRALTLIGLAWSLKD